MDSLNGIWWPRANPSEYSLASYLRYCGYILSEVIRRIRHGASVERPLRTWVTETREWYGRWLHYNRQSCWDCCSHEHFTKWVIHKPGCPQSRLIDAAERTRRQEVCAAGFRRGNGNYTEVVHMPWCQTYMLGYEHGQDCAMATWTNEV